MQMKEDTEEGLASSLKTLYTLYQSVVSRSRSEDLGLFEEAGPLPLHDVTPL